MGREYYRKGIYTRTALANRGEKFTVDLSTARSDTALGKDGEIFKVIDKGDGTWSLKFKFGDGSTFEISNTETYNGDYFTEISYDDILFTNTAQSGVTSPTFGRWWKE